MTDKDDAKGMQGIRELAHAGNAAMDQAEKAMAK
jgi:hypothetical protein